MWRKDFWNRLWNTALAAPRATVCTWLNTVSDTARTALYWVLNPIEGLWKTAGSIREAIHKACTQWPWYKRLWRAPASLIASPFMAIEWIGETLRHTTYNLCRNIRDTIAHPFLNVWKSFKSVMSKQKVWDFEFSRINHNSEVSPKNRLANLFK